MNFSMIPATQAEIANNNILVDANPEDKDLSLHGKSGWFALNDLSGELFSQNENNNKNAEEVNTIKFVYKNPAAFPSIKNVTVVTQSIVHTGMNTPRGYFSMRTEPYMHMSSQLITIRKQCLTKGNHKN